MKQNLRVLNRFNIFFFYFNLLQSSGVKGDILTEQAAKRQKVGITADPAKASTPSSSEPSASATTPCTIGMADKNKSIENIVSHSPKSNTPMALQESMSSKQQSRPSAPVGHPFLMNRYKLDNRPTAFRVTPPLPSGFADVSRSLSFSSSGIIVFAPSFMWMEFTKILLLFLFENEKMKEAHFTNNGPS